MSYPPDSDKEISSLTIFQNGRKTSTKKKSVNFTTKNPKLIPGHLLLALMTNLDEILVTRYSLNITQPMAENEVTCASVNHVHPQQVTEPHKIPLYSFSGHFGQFRAFSEQLLIFTQNFSNTFT
jgi:hypothetical protein